MPVTSWPCDARVFYDSVSDKSGRAEYDDFHTTISGFIDRQGIERFLVYKTGTPVRCLPICRYVSGVDNVVRPITHQAVVNTPDQEPQAECRLRQ